MSVSRRQMLAVGAVTSAALAAPATAQTIGNPDQPPQGLVNTRNTPRSAVDPRPQNPALYNQVRPPTRRRPPT